MKDLSKEIFVKELINSVSLIKKHAFWLVISSLVDALFFLAWGFFTTPVRNKITEHAVLVANQLSSILAEQEVRTGILSHLLGPTLRPMTGKLILLILLLFVFIYIIYTAFHGSTWWMATNIAETPRKYREYLLGFARVNLIWITGYVLYKFIDVIISLRYLIIQKFSPGAPNIAGNVLLALLVFLAMAAFLSYPRLRAGQIFKTPLKMSILLILTCAVIYLVADFILTFIGKIPMDYSIRIIIGVVILLPVFCFIRTYAIRVLSHVHTRD